MARTRRLRQLWDARLRLVHDGSYAQGRGEADTQVKGDGPIGQIVVDANAKGQVRGYVDNPEAHVPSNALGKLDWRALSERRVMCM